MSGRCKCCDAVLEEWEMKTIDPRTGKYTEFCDECDNDDVGDPDWIDIEHVEICQEDLL